MDGSVRSIHAADQGWQAKKGEKGTMVVKVVVMFRDHDAGGGGGSSAPSGGQGSGAGSDGGASQVESEQRKAMALRRYFVFNAEQIDGMPKVEEPAPLAFDPIEKAEAVI